MRMLQRGRQIKPKKIYREFRITEKEYFQLKEQLDNLKNNINPKKTRTMKPKNEKMYYDAAGNAIPAKFISKIDKERDKLVRKHINRAMQLNEHMTKFKNELLKECDQFFERMLKESNVRNLGKGNYTLSSFDKSYKIEISVQESITLDDNVQIAQAKLNEYIELITKGTNDDLRQIVNHAFQTRKGQLDVKRIISLFHLNITHPLWMDAMELLKKSLTRNISKRYIRLWVRKDDGSYKGIELNFSAI